MRSQDDTSKEIQAEEDRSFISVKFLTHQDVNAFQYYIVTAYLN